LDTLSLEDDINILSKNGNKLTQPAQQLRKTKILTPPHRNPEILHP
jgi:hypothetical protein